MKQNELSTDRYTGVTLDGALRVMVQQAELLEKYHGGAIGSSEAMRQYLALDPSVPILPPEAFLPGLGDPTEILQRHELFGPMVQELFSAALLQSRILERASEGTVPKSDAGELFRQATDPAILGINFEQMHREGDSPIENTLFHFSQWKNT